MVDLVRKPDISAAELSSVSPGAELIVKTKFQHLQQDLTQLTFVPDKYLNQDVVKENIAVE